MSLLSLQEERSSQALLEGNPMRLLGFQVFHLSARRVRGKGTELRRLRGRCILLVDGPCEDMRYRRLLFHLELIVRLELTYRQCHIHRCRPHLGCVLHDMPFAKLFSKSSQLQDQRTLGKDSVRLGCSWFRNLRRLSDEESD